MNTHTDRILRIAAFTDGRPGHFKQTQGVLNALGRLLPVEVNSFEVTHNSLFKDLLLLLGLLLPWVKYCPYDLESIDLIIGTGRRTHIYMLLCKKKYSIPIVTCMSPSYIYRIFFDLCFTPEHDNIRISENIFPTVGPPNCSVAGSEHKPMAGLVLIGGTDSNSHVWSDEDIYDHVEELVTREKNINWTISSSPRTPESCTRLLTKLSEKNSNCTFFIFENTERGWIEKEYSTNKYVWVTADSMSMVYEALSAGCNVGLLPIEWKSEKSKFSRSEKLLIENDVVISYSKWRQGQATWKSVSPLNESKRCAKEIVTRWFNKN